MVAKINMKYVQEDIGSPTNNDTLTVYIRYIPYLYAYIMTLCEYYQTLLVKYQRFLFIVLQLSAHYACNCVCINCYR